MQAIKNKTRGGWFKGEQWDTPANPTGTMHSASKSEAAVPGASIETFDKSNTKKS